MWLYLNGAWVEDSKAVIPFNDMGFLYGDSLFETIRINRGSPFRLAKHLERLGDGMITIRLRGSERMAQIPELLDTFIQKNQLETGLVRVIITRGTLQGLPWSREVSPNLYISGREISPPPEIPAKIVFYREADYPIMRFKPAIKSGNYLGNLLAKKDAAAEGAFEPVFVNTDGFVTECAIRNIFFIREGELLTPGTELGVLPGVVRDTVMELAASLGMKVREALIRLEDRVHMDEAFITSTGVGVLPVYWEGFTSNYELTKIIAASLDRLWQTGER